MNNLIRLCVFVKTNVKIIIVYLFYLMLSIYYLYSIANVAFLQKNHRSHFLWNKPASIIAFCGMICEYGCVLTLVVKLAPKPTEVEESSPALEEEFVEGC